MNIARGDVVLVTFPFSSGRGAKLRPAVVVQADRLNRVLTNTIVAMVTTTTKRVARTESQLLLDPASPAGKSSGLLHRSAVTCENLLTIEAGLVARKIGVLPTAVVGELDNCLRAALGI